MGNGRFAAAGPSSEVMARLDLTPFADLEAGAVLEAEILSHDESFGLTTLRLGGGELRVPRLDKRQLGTKVRVHIRARDVMISTRAPEGLSALNVLRGVVAELGPCDGPVLDLRLDCGGEAILARLTRRPLETPGLSIVQPCNRVIKT